MAWHPSLVRFAKCCLLGVGWAAGIAAFVWICSYGSDAYMRYVHMPDCVWEAVPNPHGHPYEVHFCYLTKGTVVVRVHDLSGKHLLAERIFFELDRPRFYWGPEFFGYSNERYGGLISIPPTLIDRLRAKLP